LTAEELLKQKKAEAETLSGEINTVSREIEALSKKRIELLEKAIKLNGAIEALNQLLK